MKIHPVEPNCSMQTDTDMMNIIMLFAILRMCLKMVPNLQVCLKRCWAALYHVFLALYPTYNSCKVWFYFNRHVVKNQQWLLQKGSSYGWVFHCSVNHKNKASHTFPYSHVFTVLPSFLISLFIFFFLVSIYIPGRIPPFNFTSFPLPVTNRNMAKVILIYHFWIVLPLSNVRKASCFYSMWTTTFFFSIWHINGRKLLYEKLVISINKVNICVTEPSNKKQTKASNIKYCIQCRQ